MRWSFSACERPERPLGGAPCSADETGGIGSNVVGYPAAKLGGGGGASGGSFSPVGHTHRAAA